MATSELNWGILATGWIAELFVKDLKSHGHNVVAVGSRGQARADRFASAFGISRAHGSYEDLVADPGVDIVYVATPHVFHAENAKLALNAGKHVLIEKPFTLNASEAKEVVDLATSKGLVVLEAMWTRFLPHMVRLRQIIASGAIGEIKAVTADHLQLLPQDPAHRLNAIELGGGALLDLGIYPISLAWDVLGAPVSISASARMSPTGVDAAIATVMQHANGAISNTLSALDLPGVNRAKILGTCGWIEIDDVWYTPTGLRVYDAQGVLIEHFEAGVTGRGMHFQAIEMEMLVSQGLTQSTIMPPAQSVAIIATLDAIRSQVALRYPSEPQLA